MWCRGELLWMYRESISVVLLLWCGLGSVCMF